MRGNVNFAYGGGGGGMAMPLPAYAGGLFGGPISNPANPPYKVPGKRKNPKAPMFLPNPNAGAQGNGPTISKIEKAYNCVLFEKF
jgi:hypothetical protein